MQLAVAANVIGVVTASSPGPSPAATAAPWSAAVPELKATAWRTPAKAASAPSKAGTRGPVVSQSDRSAAATAATSSSEIDCRAYGSIVERTGSPPSIASRALVLVVIGTVLRSPDRDPRLHPPGHPAPDPAKALLQRHLRSPAQHPRRLACVAAQHRDLALRVDVLDVDDPRRVRLDERGQPVDVDVGARARVQDPAGRRVAQQRVDDEPGAIRGIEQVPRLGAVAVDPERLAAEREPGEDRDDPALAHGALEGPVRVERPDDRR